MNKISYRSHRFPPEIIQNVVWLHFRFPLSFRNVEDLLAERRIDVSYETLRRWSVKNMEQGDGENCSISEHHVHLFGDSSMRP